MSEGLDDILNGVDEPEVVETPEVAEAEPVVETAEPEKPEQPRGPDGKFAPKGDKEVAPPAAEEDRVPVTAIQDERRKRQELERRLAEYEQQLKQLSTPPQPAPDMFDDPAGWQGHFGQQISQQAVSQASLNATLNTSEMLARDKFDDFEEMKSAFMELAQENPTLAQQALSDPHPWRKAYQIAKTHKTMEQVAATDVDGLRAAIRAEIEAELKAQKPTAAVEIPESLAGAQSGKAINGLSDATPPSLSDILGR